MSGAARQADSAEAVEQRGVSWPRGGTPPAGRRRARSRACRPSSVISARADRLGHRVGLRGEPHLRGRRQWPVHPVSTHVSFAPPPGTSSTTSAPSSNATRVRPPGATRAVVVASEEDKGPQVDVARRQLAVDHGRMARAHYTALGHERGRGLEHGLANRLDIPRLGVREDRDALAAVAATRLDHELVEDVIARSRISGRPRSKVSTEGAAAPHPGRSESCPRRRRASACCPPPNALTTPMRPSRIQSYCRPTDVSSRSAFVRR